MGYILKNTSGLINTRLTDTGRQKLSEGRFNISYFQVGDSEVSYNTLPSTYNQMDTNILEPEFNAQNSTGVPESNKHQVKYPYYVDAGSKNTFGVPFMASVPTSIFNRAAMRGFFSGNTTAETISWSALTNDQYAINANYVVDMSAITCTDTIDLILSSCYTDPVREPQAGDFVTIYYDGNGLTDCSCVYPPPTPTCQTDCWTTGFTLNIKFDPIQETIGVLPMVDSGTLVNGKPYYYSYPYPASVYWNGSSWILDITTTTEKNLGSSPIGSFTGVSAFEEQFISGYTECGESNYICLKYCQENQECNQIVMLKANVSGQTFYFSIEGDYLIGFDNDEFILLSGDTQVGVLTGLTENVYPVGSFSAASPFTAITTTLGWCPSLINIFCDCVSMTADSGNDLVRYYDCNGFLQNEEVGSGNTFSACTLFTTFNALSGGTTDLCEVDCSTLSLGNYSPQIYSSEPCITPSPTPTPSATCCPVPSPTPACPLPEPHASCVMDMDSCHMVLTYRITRVCGNTIYLDRNTPDFSNYSNCYARLIIYPSSINEIYDSYTPRPHWNDNVIDFESVCGVDAFDVKIWNMNIPWSENPAGLDPTISSDYTTFASRTYLGSKEYFGYASSSGQTFYNPVTSATTTTDTFYYNSLGDIIDVQPKEQKAIAIIHYTNNAIDLFYGEKFALQPYDPQNPQDTTGQARNFKLHLPWVMWHKNPTCCNGETFYVDPEGFDELDLFQVHYILSKKNTNMNNPGIRYYHLWDTHPNPDGYPSRVGKVFPDHKLIVIDDEELIAVMSYKSNRNWTLPAPRLSLITPNTCGNDNNSTTGILSGNGQTLYVTYKLSDPQTCIENLHCNYYPYLTGPNLNCNNIQPQNVAVRFGSEFNCLNRAGIDCWQNEFTITQYIDLPFSLYLINVYKFKNTYTYLNGKPIYSENIFGSNVYWDGQNWVLDNPIITSPIVIGPTPLGSFVDSSQDPPLYFTSSCEPSTYICLTACNETECNSISLFYQNISDLLIQWVPNGDGNTIEWSADTQEFVALSGSTPIGILTGLTENDFPIGTFTPISPFTAVTSTAGTCELTCSCIEFTAGTCGYDLQYMDCNGILNTETLSGSQVFSACVLNNLYNENESLTTGSCVSECYTTTTTTCPPLGCLINEGYYSTKFEIVCQLVEGGGRPESDLWKIIDFTPQISGTTINGYLTQSGLTGNTFVITLDDYNNAPFYDLNDYISLPSVGSTGYSLNFGDEYYFYGNLETDIQATIYEMKYKVNLSQTEFQISSNPTWTLGTSSYITEIGLYDNEKDLMIVSKLQSPVLRQNVQQFLIKFDF